MKKTYMIYRVEETALSPTFNEAVAVLKKHDLEPGILNYPDEAPSTGGFLSAENVSPSVGRKLKAELPGWTVRPELHFKLI